MPHPVSQRRERFSSALDRTLFQERFVGMPQDDAVESLPKAIHGICLHFTDQFLLLLRVKLAARAGADPRQRPEDPRGNVPLHPVEETAPQDLPQQQISTVFAVHEIAVGHQGLPALQVENGRLPVHREARDSGEIILEEKIMVPFAQADARPGVSQDHQLFNNGHEVRVHAFAPAEPEIEKITGDEQVVELLRAERLEEAHQVPVALVPFAFQVGVGKEDAFHGVALINTNSARAKDEIEPAAPVCACRKSAEKPLTIRRLFR